MTLHLTKFGQGLPLVFFHGWGFDSSIWLPLVPSLKAHYEIILVDLPGFGRSAMLDWSAFTRRVLRLLPEQFSLLGWSLGGLYATRLALETPIRVKSLLNVGSSPCFLGEGNWPGVESDLLSLFYQRLLVDPRATLNEFIALQMKNTKGQITPTIMPSQEGLEAGLNSLATWDLREPLKNMQTPACFLFGKLDPLASVKTMKAMQAAYPNFQYVLFDKSAHMPFLSQTDDFIKLVLECIP